MGRLYFSYLAEDYKYNKCMARFINTGDQNKANMEDKRCNQKIFCT